MFWQDPNVREKELYWHSLGEVLKEATARLST